MKSTDIKKKIAEEVMKKVAEQDFFPRSYNEGNRTIEMNVSDIDPVLYIGMAEPNIYADIRISDCKGLLSFSQRVELGASFYRKLTRENVPCGKQYFQDINPKVNKLLVDFLNESQIVMELFK